MMRSSRLHTVYGQNSSSGCHHCQWSSRKFWHGLLAVAVLMLTLRLMDDVGRLELEFCPFLTAYGHGWNASCMKIPAELKTGEKNLESNRLDSFKRSIRVDSSSSFSTGLAGWTGIFPTTDGVVNWPQGEEFSDATQLTETRGPPDKSCNRSWRGLVMVLYLTTQSLGTA